MSEELIDAASRVAEMVSESMASLVKGNSEESVLNAFCDEFGTLLYNWQMRLGEIEEVEGDE